VQGLAVNLERNKDGRTNWEDLVKAQPEETPEKVETEPTVSGDLSIGGVDVRDASVSLNDRASGQRVAVNDLFIKTSAITLVDPVDVKIGFTVDTGAIGLTGKVDTGVRMNIDLKDQIYAMRDLRLSAELKGETLPGGSATIIGEGDLAVDAGARRIDLSRFKLESGGLSMPPYTAAAVFETEGTGDLAAKTFEFPGFRAAVTMTKGEERINAGLEGKLLADLTAQKLTVSELALSLPEFSSEGIRMQLSAPQKATAALDLAAMTLMVDGLKIAGTISGKSLPGGSMPVELDMRVRGDLSRQTLSVDPMQLEALGMKTKGSLSVSKFQTAPEVSGSLNIARFNPRELLKRLMKDVPKTADPKALSSAELSVAFTAAANTLKVDKLAAGIDDSRLTVSAEVSNFDAPDVRFELAADRINADRYLPLKHTGGAAPATAASPAGAASTAGMPLENLRKLTIDGKLRVSDLTASGVNMTHLVVGIRAKDGVIRTERLNADGILTGKLNFGLDGSGTVLDLNDQTLSAERLLLTVGDMKLAVKAKVADLLKKPSYKADIRVPAFNLRQMLAKVGRNPPETTDPKAMTATGLTASVSGTPGAVSVEPLTVRLDDTRMEGKLEVKSQPAPAYVFDIRIDALDADRYLPPRKKETKPAAVSAGTTAAALPVDTVKALNLDGKFTVGKLKISNVRLQDIQMQARAKDGLVTMNPLSAALYGGTVNGTVTIDARGEQPQLDLNEKLADVQAGPFLKDLQGRSMLTGLTNAGIMLTATGTDSDAMTRTLNGKIDFQITNGSIEKVDIVGQICRALSSVSIPSLKKEDITAGVLQMVTKQARGGETQSGDRTEFSEMGGSMVFTNGIGANDDLTLKSPLLRVEGAGKIDLPKQYLDYQVTAALVKSCEGQGGKSYRELANYPIPVTISGPLDNLNVKPNFTAGILKVLQQQRPTEQKPAAPLPQQPLQPQQPADTKKQAEDAVKDMLQKGMQDLFKKK
jgi:uncharacterized protein involved in outer membrane biogenesis